MRAQCDRVSINAPRQIDSINQKCSGQFSRGSIQYLLDRPGNQEVQLELFLDYGTNLVEYPIWQALFREYQPPALLMWGKNDPIFPEEGAHPYKQDLKNLEFHILDTGHFALEEFGVEMSAEILEFLDEVNTSTN